MKSERVVAEAREWIGTPFVPQQHTKGVGCDCLGLVVGIAFELGLVPADFWSNAFRPYQGYGQSPHQGRLMQGCRQFLDEIAVGEAGDVVVMRFGDEPQHMGVLVPYVHGGLAVVHALARSPGCVTEHRLANVWRARIVAAFRYPGVD